MRQETPRQCIEHKTRCVIPFAVTQRFNDGAANFINPEFAAHIGHMP
jgi:hypothetical protein